jgi:general secretion pathway protein G
MALAHPRRAFFMALSALALAGSAFAACWPTCPRVTVRARETALRENLFTLRQCIHQYHQDKGRYPASLRVLSAERYIRKVPMDPFTRSDTTWQVIHAPGRGGVADVRSGFHGTASDGSRYESW